MPELINDIAAAVNDHLGRVAAHTDAYRGREHASQGQVDGAATAVPSTEYRYVRTLADSGAVDGLVDALQNPDGRFMWGIRDLDVLMRGVGPGELCLLTGMPHSGKTQLLFQAICNAPRGRYLLFTFDEVTELVLLKLAAVMRGLDPEQVEKRITQGDTEIVAVLKDVAANEFPNLVVIDDLLDFDEMRRALMEAEDFWGAPAQGVFLDYVESIAGDADHNGTQWKLGESKRFAKATKRPCVFIHQARTRGDSKRGQPQGMGGMRYGGEDVATFVVEVYRRSQDQQLDEFERQAEANTVNVNLCKNKRPPSKTGDVKLHMHPYTGAIRPLAEGEFRDPMDRPVEDQYGPLVDRATYHAAPVVSSVQEEAPSAPTTQELF